MAQHPFHPSRRMQDEKPESGLHPPSLDGPGRGGVQAANPNTYLFPATYEHCASPSVKKQKKDGQDIMTPLIKLSRHWRLHCGDKRIKRQFFGGTFGVLSLTPKAAKQRLTRPKRAKEEIRAMGRQDTPVHRAPATCQAARGARRTHLEPLLQRVRTCPRRVWASSNADT